MVNKQITQGSLLRAMASLSPPLILQNFVTIGGTMADLFWLGRYSTTAVGAVG